MNKNLKVRNRIMFVILILISIVILAFAFFNQYDIYEGTIIGIDDNSNNIFVSGQLEELNKITTYNEFEESYGNSYVLLADYRITITDITIQDNNRNIVNKEDLQIGDNVKIIYKKSKTSEMTNPPLLENIKTITIIK